MKNLLHVSCLILLCFFLGCKRDNDVDMSVLRDGRLGLYWAHQVSSEGRRFLMDFGAKPQKDDYDLEFDYTIQDRTITVRLVKTIHKGKCAVFPGPYGNLCTPNGTIYIPEDLLKPGTYNFNLITKDFSVASKLTIDTEKVTLEVPPNDYLHNNIRDVFPTPKGLVIGNISYSGSANEKFANDLIKDFATLGMTPAEIPVHPYSDFNIEQNKHLQKNSWEPDEHSISILYRSDANFKSIFEMAKKHFEISGKKLTIGMFSSNNADQAFMSPQEEPRVFYGK